MRGFRTAEHSEEFEATCPALHAFATGSSYSSFVEVRDLRHRTCSLHRQLAETSEAENLQIMTTFGIPHDLLWAQPQAKHDSPARGLCTRSQLGYAVLTFAFFWSAARATQCYTAIHVWLGPCHCLMQSANTAQKIAVNWLRDFFFADA